MRAAVIAYTVNGAILAEKLRHLSDDETDIYVSAKSAKYIDAENIITFKYFIIHVLTNIRVYIQST